MSKKDAKTNDNIVIIDWAGNVLFRGHYQDKKVDKVLDANRCKECPSGDDRYDACDKCDDTGYSGDFSVEWEEETAHENENVYEFINY